MSTAILPHRYLLFIFIHLHSICIAYACIVYYFGYKYLYSTHLTYWLSAS